MGCLAALGPLQGCWRLDLILFCWRLSVLSLHQSRRAACILRRRRCGATTINVLRKTRDFLQWRNAGDKKRLAECVPDNNCSPEGTTFMEYVDSLALSVKNKKMTEAEAMRRYAEYKSGGASTCTAIGNAVKCY